MNEMQVKVHECTKCIQAVLYCQRNMHTSASSRDNIHRYTTEAVPRIIDTETAKKQKIFYWNLRLTESTLCIII